MNTEDKVLQVPIEYIIPNRFQPRLAFDNDSLKELAESIKQHGIIQPLVLRRLGDKYEIIAGERRYKAATMAGLVTVPAIISNVDDKTSAEMAIVENVQRKDLTAIEEAKSYKAILDKGYMTQEDLAKKMGLSQSAISNKLRLLSLDEEVQQAILNEEISERHARSLLKIKDPEDQKKMLSRIINERLTVRRLEEEIKHMNGEENDVPLVSSTPDIDAIKANATDITANNRPKTAEEMGMSNPSFNMFSNQQTESPKDEVVEEPPKEINEPKEVQSSPINTSNMFSSSEAMPNKFFNFLEDEAANMDVEETPIFANQFNLESPKEEVVEDTSNIVEPVVPNSDDIEMLDFGPLESKQINGTETKGLLVDDIIGKIRGLNLSSDQVRIEEINFPDEYHINIIIKKDS